MHCIQRDYTEHYLKTEHDEKGNEIQRLIPAPRALQCALPLADMVCVQDNGSFVSSDSFKYCSRVIHHELKLAFNYHSLRHSHATFLIESGSRTQCTHDHTSYCCLLPYRPAVTVYERLARKICRGIWSRLECSCRSHI